MKKELIVTADGSHTLEVPELQVTYHSRHGAIQESVHVYINAGFDHVCQITQGEIRVFEMGLGTGLNALLTLMAAGAQQRKVQYTAIEPYPLTAEEASTLNYPALLHHKAELALLHQETWGKTISLSHFFTFRKEKASLQDASFAQSFHLVYYDAFAPSAQPELWTETIFRKLNHLLLPGGVLVTYCSKSVVRKAMEAAGFIVSKIPGPFGKREMVRAQKRKESGLQC